MEVLVLVPRIIRRTYGLLSGKAATDMVFGVQGPRIINGICLVIGSKNCGHRVAGSGPADDEEDIINTGMRLVLRLRSIKNSLRLG